MVMSATNASRTGQDPTQPQQPPPPQSQVWMDFYVLKSSGEVGGNKSAQNIVVFGMPDTQR